MRAAGCLKVGGMGTGRRPRADAPWAGLWRPQFFFLWLERKCTRMGAWLMPNILRRARSR